MRITFLGTGTSQGVPVIGCQCKVCLSDNTKDKRLRPSIFIETEHKKFIIDCGPDFRQQMLTNGINDIDFILISHQHNDHVIGLDDVRPINFKHNKTIPLFASLDVGNDLKHRFEYIFGANAYPGLPQIELNTINAGSQLKMQGLEIKIIEVMHGKLPVLAFRIGNFGYITDANFLDANAKVSFSGCDVLVVNALHHKPHHAHFNLDQALSLISDLNPGKAYLTHMSHNMGLYEEIQPQLPPPVNLSYDGLCITV